VLHGAVPPTTILQLQDEDYVDEALCDLEPKVRTSLASAENPGRWILKPSITNGAAEISVIDDETQVT